MHQKYDTIPSNLFIINRKKFFSEIKNDSLSVFNSNDIYPVSSDSILPFQQHRDIFWLTGIDQEESVVVFFKKNNISQTHLFIKETNEHIKIWEGDKLSKQDAQTVSGIQDIHFLKDFERIFKELVHEVSNIYINQNKTVRTPTQVQTREDRFILWCKENFKTKNYLNSNPILQSLRSVKEPQEIDILQKACGITEKGFRRVLNFTRPEIFEYQIESELIHEFLNHGSKGFAYSPIVASGKNACVLHYTKNNSVIKQGEIILMDTAAEYANYSSDLTRCIPSSGRFSKRQKEIYSAVLSIKTFAEQILVSGNTFKNYNKSIGEFVTSTLQDLRLLDLSDIQNESKENPAYKKYFMHGTSHFLGLDTHDYGDYEAPFKENMVFTIEPGIYLPEENLGIRLEDNYVVQKEGNPFNLMKNIPIEIEEIEDLMNQ